MTETTAAGEAAHAVASFSEVFRAELDDITTRRGRLGRTDLDALEVAGGPRTDRGLAGLALSGGGIRSAAFALGVVQGLHAQSRDQPLSTIERMDYLSTVSGGGYLGTAMTICMSERGGRFPYGLTGQDAGETPETRHLRDNSRYLVRGGIGAVLAAFVVYMRGIVLSVLVLLPILLAAAALLLFIAPNTSWLAATWWVPDGLRPAVAGYRMPLSILILLGLAALWFVYVLLVSNIRIVSVARRRLIAEIATWVMVLACGLIVIEAHLAIMRAVFDSPQAATGAAPSTATPQPLLTWLAGWISWLSPVVLAILPFVQKLGEKAASEAVGGYGAKLAKIGSRALLLFAAAIVPLMIWLAMMLLFYWGVGVSECVAVPPATCDGARSYAHAPDWLSRLFDKSAGAFSYQVAVLYGLAAIVFLVLWRLLNVNANSLHQLYRDRLGYAFLQRRATDGDGVPVEPAAMEPADEFLLSGINPGCAAYHLINAAVNVPGSRFANQRGRNADFFLFSPRFIGCELTGYAPTRAAERVVDGLTIGTAMAISGAAAAPNMGMASIAPLSPTLAFLNVRLGRWVLNPRAIVALVGSGQATGGPGSTSGWPRFPGPRYLLREAFAKSGVGVRRPGATTADNSYLFLTDGGHIENLGVYGLLRRRCKLIIVVDAEADPDYQFPALVRLERFARIDFGVSIDMDWTAIGARSRLVSEACKKGAAPTGPAEGPHAALGYIHYPVVPGDANPQPGLLLYIKASLSGDENDYVTAYKAAHPVFPQESTADQFFSEEQFEVYRALGEHIARRVADGTSPVAARPDDNDSLIAEWNQLLPSMALR
ncbi:hypothetical protein [Phreatobacter stygius]|uniref:PNPLA domain-containing protein n=1 Tax=Phreatobacter stygius TaxID=1940610 RepID=A0A4D7BG64_9HYPH|nr:hypothetical protein [Phreatobacter stygius]QCI66852.1 hypothetical protein E8M01_22975 [Phreatobacter stygius]